MAIQGSFKRICDRCQADMGEAFPGDEQEYKSPILILESVELEVGMKTFHDLCDVCKKELKPLLKKVVQVSRKKPAPKPAKKRKKSGGKA